MYQPSRNHFPTAQDAIQAVQQYGEGSHHAGALPLIMAKYFANHTGGTIGPFGGFYLAVDELMQVFGVSKHKHGGYAEEDRQRFIDVVESLARIEVNHPSRCVMEQQEGPFSARL